jgi:diguanylate cyclase
MKGLYNPGLIALSIAIAIIASYTALDLAGRVSANTSSTRKAWLWLVSGAVGMGTGIWAMHFVGMLAFHLPVPVAYDLSTTLFSLLIAVVVSGVALLILRRPALEAQNLTIGATVMGIGISTMHYTGMAAMQMSPPIRYDAALFVTSVLIAIVASLAALWIAFQLRTKYSRLAILAKLGSAGVMGLAITGMHYTGMAAAQFAPDSICLSAEQGGINNVTLAIGVGAITVLILSTTLFVSALDAHIASTNTKLALSLQAANEQLRNIALFDNLTGLPNRLLLEDRLNQAVVHSDRTNRPFALLFVDLDRFKPVNDSYGHRVGDFLLQAVARRLACALRKADTVARIGGDEFIVLLEDLVQPTDAAVIGKKILADLANPFGILGHQLFISCSIGISVYPKHGKDIATLMTNADAAMYVAKQQGRNGYRFFMPAVLPGIEGTSL